MSWLLLGPLFAQGGHTGILFTTQESLAVCHTRRPASW